MQEQKRNTFKKAERLCSRKRIELLYKKGKSIKEPSFVLLYMESELESEFPAQSLFSVSKRLYKRAVDRNRVKRLMRESFRTSKHKVYHKLEKDGKQMALMFLYTGRRLPNQDYVNSKISSLLKRLEKEIS